jgi:hypothetical protein
MPLKLAHTGDVVRVLQMMPPHPNPRIQPLQRKLQVFVCLQLNHRKPSIDSHTQQVEHTPICRRKRRLLGINMRRIKMSIERLHITS